MRDYAEKRDYYRMSVRCTMRIQSLNTGMSEEAELQDLSATGLRFRSHHELGEGERLRVLVPSGSELTPPLLAEISVVRCVLDGDGFEVAAAIETIASDEDAALAMAS